MAKHLKLSSGTVLEMQVAGRRKKLRSENTESYS